MITKKTKDNEELYQQLFRDAETVLNVPSGSINTLDEYLLNLEDLRDFEKDEKYSLRFSRLPVDEPPFAINASSRIIDIPADFKKNGIAVIGDHLAEVLYFTIDRYYDTWDLLDPSIQVVAQWSYVSGGKTVRSGISIIAPDESENGYSIRKDAKVFASDDKIMFGWPINNTIAQEAGSIKFSIRFFKIASGHLVFNMNTIPTTVEIKNGLDFVDADGNLLENAIDDINLLEWRFRDGQGYKGGIHGADDPTYVIPLSFYNAETKTITAANDDDPIVIDLNENGELTFGLLATGNGTSIDYKGYFKNDSTDATFSQHPMIDFYCVTGDTAPIPGKIYYEWDETEETYGTANITAGEGFDEEKTYYEKLPGMTADSIGTYYISITNVRKPSDEEEENEYTWSKATINSAKVKIPGPGEPSIEAPTSVYLDSENKLYITITGSTEQNGDKITYKVGELPAVEGQTSGEPYTFYVGQIVGTEEEPVNMYKEEYVASVIATRNGGESKAITATIVASYPTEAPTVEITSSVELPNHANNDVLTAVITNENNIQSESFAYQWHIVVGSADYGSEETNDIAIEGATEANFIPTQGGAYYCTVINTVNGLSNSGTSRYITVI